MRRQRIRLFGSSNRLVDRRPTPMTAGLAKVWSGIHYKHPIHWHLDPNRPDRLPRVLINKNIHINLINVLNSVRLRPGFLKVPGVLDANRGGKYPDHYIELFGRNMF